MEDKTKNPFYHTTEKGCELIKVKKKMSDKKYDVLTCLYCKTHNKLVCRCGWEFGHHPSNQ